MKMGAGLFWGIILIVIGVSLIFRIFFDISLFRIIIATAFILIGVKMLIGRNVVARHQTDNQVVFGERIINSDPENGTEYSTVFGKTVYDFRSMTKTASDEIYIEMNTVFGETEILLPDGVAVNVKADAAFAAAIMPNGNSVSFGSTYFKTDRLDSASMPKLNIEAHVVFGQLKIRQSEVF